MNTMAEIEAAADALSPEQKQELPLFLARKSRAEGAPLPAVRRFTREQMAEWIAKDDADLSNGRGAE